MRNRRTFVIAIAIPFASAKFTPAVGGLITTARHRGAIPVRCAFRGIFSSKSAKEAHQC